MTEHKCPICGKSDLPDYRKKKTICPACDMDLSAFVLINSGHSKTSVGWKIFSVLSIIAILWLSYSSFFHKTNTVIVYKDEKVLRDSINFLRQQNSKLLDLLKKPTYIYTVRQGDSFNKIGKLLFGSEKFGEEIAKANSMETSNLIYPGLKLKMPQK